jgi:transcriptional regulator with XRE-family HTH domain
MRLQRKMTQVQLAEIVGVTQGMIVRWESGRDVPPADQRTTIACVLGVNQDCLWPPGEVLEWLDS